ncbi:hypothetical protein H671_2g6302 [Cricetulus griseus]|nr:hypothetical protein H671_2g6302 [Cricetulus griseus]
MPKETAQESLPDYTPSKPEYPVYKAKKKVTTMGSSSRDGEEQLTNSLSFVSESAPTLYTALIEGAGVFLKSSGYKGRCVQTNAARQCSPWRMMPQRMKEESWACTSDTGELSHKSSIQQKYLQTNQGKSGPTLPEQLYIIISPHAQDSQTLNPKVIFRKTEWLICSFKDRDHLNLQPPQQSDVRNDDDIDTCPFTQLWYAWSRELHELHFPSSAHTSSSALAYKEYADMSGNACGGQKRASDPLELELQGSVNYLTWSRERALLYQQALLTTGPPFP